MSEFQLSHIALVGARMDAFEEHGIRSRNELKMRRVAPVDQGASLADASLGEQRSILQKQLPLWVHNIITDPEFPQREKLLMHLRRFEGELKDNRENEVISSVMTAGFKSEPLNPLSLPKGMSMAQRCAIVAQINVWQAAYSKLEEEVVSLLLEQVDALTQWSELASQPGRSTVEYEEN